MQPGPEQNHPNTKSAADVNWEPLSMLQWHLCLYRLEISGLKYENTNIDTSNKILVREKIQYDRDLRIPSSSLGCSSCDKIHAVLQFLNQNNLLLIALHSWKDIWICICKLALLWTDCKARVWRLERGWSASRPASLHFYRSSRHYAAICGI